MGWYHSHPFDVEVHSHCFLSSTDVQTQLSWQLAMDKTDPWLAIVVRATLHPPPRTHTDTRAWLVCAVGELGPADN
jgi:proteasome lid subunit RPN8/RPN11